MGKPCRPYALHSIPCLHSSASVQTFVACTVARGGKSTVHGALLHMICPGAMVSKSPAVCDAYVTAGVSNSLLKVRLSER